LRSEREKPERNRERNGDERSIESRPTFGFVIAPVLVAGVCIAFQLPIFDRWFSHMDEGHVLLFSDLIAKGGDLYRDATLYPLPGAFYLLAQLFKLFGSSILVSRWIVMLEFAAFVVMVYVLMRGLTSRLGAAAAVSLMLVYRIWAFPHWQVYSYSTTSLLAILAALLCQLRWFEGRRTGWLVASGLLFGFAVYCKQDYGAAALLVMTTLLVADGRARRRPVLGPLAVFVGAGAAVGATVGLYFAAQGILADLLQQTTHHLRGIGAFEYTTYPSLLPLFAQDPDLRTQSGVFAFFPGIVTTVDLETLRQNFLFRETVVYDVALKLFYWGPYGFAAFALVRVFRTRALLRDTEHRPAWLREATLAGLTATFVLLLTLNRPQDFLHVAVLIWPMLCLTVVYAEALSRSQRTLALLLCALLAVPSLALLAYSGRGYWLLRTHNTELVPLPRAGIRVRPSEARMLRDVAAFMRDNTSPHEPVAVVPYFPIAHFLADRVGPHRSAYIIWPFAEFEDRDQQIIDAIERTGTDLAVYNFTQFRTFPRMREFAPDLFNHLVDHFETVTVFSHDKSGFRLAGLRRSNQPEEASALLDAAWPETTVWIGSDVGPPLAILPAERASFVGRESWPFRRTLALRPSSGGTRTIFRLPVEASRGEGIHTAIGLHPEMWFAMPSFETHFEIAIVSGAPPRLQRKEVFTRTLDPHHSIGDRGWFEVTVPLEPWAGQRVLLELAVSVDAPDGESLLVGGFEEPRTIVLGPTSAAMAD
jgi:hypothetical protein